MKVIRTERGWAGHYICGHHCLFRRNTLLESGDVRIVVSTVGNLHIPQRDGSSKSDSIGAGERMYETMAFHAIKEGVYWEADVHRQVDFTSEWAICTEKIAAEDDQRANDMHEAVVEELTKRMKRGSKMGDK